MKKIIKLTESDLIGLIEKVINEQDMKLTDQELIKLGRKVYLKTGENRTKEYDEDVEKLQKYFNSTGTLGDGKKYKKLKENGIYDMDTYWQLNNWLASIDNKWWKQNKY
jgi:hypothetical protein